MNEEAIFYQALELQDPLERAQYIEEACGDDMQLRRQVEELLKSHEEAGSFLQPQCREDAATMASREGKPVSTPSAQTVSIAESESSPAHPASPLGASVRYFGDYELQGEISRGGMGVVYRARQVHTNRPVALKMILSGAMADEKEVLRFHTEAEAAASLDHPSIVPIYEVGEKEGLHYFSMKLIEGNSLNQRLSQYRSNPIAAAGLMETVSRAVHHAHQRGILHRDLKPGNVLLDAQGQPFVTDFGLAKRIDSKESITQSGAILGTPEYLSPEQARGEKHLTIASDVYGLGAILYALLTGKPPFQGPTVLEILQQVVREEPIAPSKLQPGIPLDLETICLKCLQKDPKNRYGSAEELAEDLRRYQAGEPIAARPVGAIEKGWRWCQRNPTVATLMALVLLSLCAGTGVSTWFALEAADKAKSEKIRADSERKAREELAEQKKKTEDALTLSRSTTYGLRIDGAWQSLLQGNLPDARSRLSLTSTDLRGWEHDLLRKQTEKLKLELRGHTNGVTGVAFSPNGKRIVSGSWDKTVRTWNATTGKELLTLKGHDSWIMCVAFSPNGRRIASGGGWDKTVKLWDATTGKELFTMRGHKVAVRSIAFNGYGNNLVSGG